jgi:hypothetical protein
MQEGGPAPAQKLQNEGGLTMANSGLIQGMDTIPTEVLRKYGDFIAEYLPGWTPSGFYQFQPGAYTQMASAQTGFLEHRGPHAWVPVTVHSIGVPVTGFR